MMKYFLSTLTLLAAISLSACSNRDSYQEPTMSSNGTAVVQVKNGNFLGSLAGQFVMKPHYLLTITSIDGKTPGFSTLDSLRVSPGRHTIEVACSINGSSIGKTVVVINAKPQRTYTIFYPESTRGFTYDTEACQKLMVN